MFLIAVSNPDATINAIKTIVCMSNPQDAFGATPRDFIGRKIHSITLKPCRRPPAAQPPRSLYVSASGGYLALSTDSAILEDYLRSAGGQDKPLRDNPGLQAALAHLGGAGAGCSATRTSAKPCASPSRPSKTPSPPIPR